MYGSRYALRPRLAVRHFPLLSTRRPFSDWCLGVVFVFLMGLELDGGVVDAEFVFEVFADLVEEVVVEGGGGFDEVGGEGGLGGAEGPDVDVVDAGDAGEGFQIGADGGGVDGLGDGVEAEVEGVAEEFPGAEENEDADNDADDGVEEVPAGGEDDEAGDHDACGDGSVGGHVEEGAADIEVALPAGHEHEGGDAIDEDAEGGDPGHGASGDFGGGAEALDGFPEDAADADEEEQGIKEGGEDGGAFPSVGAAVGGGLAGEGAGDPGEDEAHDIGDIVPGVGEEGEGVGHEAGDDLEDDEAGIQRDADDEGSAKIGGGVMVARVGMVVVVMSHGGDLLPLIAHLVNPALEPDGFAG